MDNIKIAFKIDKLPLSKALYKNGESALEINARDKELTIMVKYSHSPDPLILRSEIKEGDYIEAVFLDYRIELYVNCKLMDEEWPLGDRSFGMKDAPSLVKQGITACRYEPNEKKEPRVIGVFENAEGWYPGNGVFVGDCMPYVKDNTYHVLYLKDRHHHKSKWGMGAHQWEHISTKDFKTWEIHPIAVPITSQEECSICTGSHIQGKDCEHLYYTVRRANGLPALIKRSISSDGYHFTKDENFGFTLSEKYNGQIARDPKVFLGEDGKYHMILTTVLLKENKGCLAHYVSNDLNAWQECANPIYVYENSDHPECPDYFKYMGKYYLVFSIRGRARYLVSKKPFDGFERIDDSLIPCAGVPKCAIWGDKLIFTGFKVIDGYAGAMTFKSATAKEDGTLIFEEL